VSQNILPNKCEQTKSICYGVVVQGILQSAAGHGQCTMVFPFVLEYAGKVFDHLISP
jgi:hypothetical protein